MGVSDSMNPRLNRREFLRTVGFAAAVVALPGCSRSLRSGSASNEERRPNFVIVFIDDMGYADVGCFGAEGYKTPNIDRLAAEGTRFTDFYAAASVCTPSRAALLTGCYPQRVSLPNVLGPRSQIGISDQEVTIAQMLKPLGYATACFGKWHLGHQPQFLPTIARLTGARLPDHTIDGKDIWPLIAGQRGARSPHEAFFYYQGWALEAVRSDRWKLHFPHGYRTLNGRPGGTGGIPAKYEQAKIDVALFDLENDISEQHNVADQHPDIVARLQRLADVMRQDLGDSLQKTTGAGRRPPGKI